MVRSALAVLALVALFLGTLAPRASAQEPAPGEPESRTHTVVEGNTLWSLAERYLGQGDLWRAIWEVNRDRLDDPSVLQPGTVLLIPEPAPGETRVAVRGVEVVTTGERVPDAVVADPAAEDPVEEAVEPGVGVATGAQGVPERRRTVFHPAAATGVEVSDAPPAPGLAFSRDVFHRAPWLVPPGGPVEHDGTLTGFRNEAEAKTTVRPFEEVRVSGEGPFPGAGGRLQVFRVTDRTTGGLGGRAIVIPTGTLTVLERTDAGVLAAVDRVYDHMEIGDFVRGLGDFPLEPGEEARPAAATLVTEVGGFGRLHALEAEGDWVFLAAGRDRGVRPGDVFAVGGGPDAEPSEPRARLRVVAVDGDYATAWIERLTNPGFHIGVAARLIERLP